jgi:hypothetical protein
VFAKGLLKRGWKPDGQNPILFLEACPAYRESDQHADPQRAAYPQMVGEPSPMTSGWKTISAIKVISLHVPCVLEQHCGQLETYQEDLYLHRPARAILLWESVCGTALVQGATHVYQRVRRMRRAILFTHEAKPGHMRDDLSQSARSKGGESVSLCPQNLATKITT